MMPYRQQIEAAAKAVQIQSLTRYSWFGKPNEKLPGSISRHLNDQTARSILLYSLHMKLYRDFYTRGFASPEVREAGHSAADVGPGGCGSGCGSTAPVDLVQLSTDVPMERSDLQ